MQLEFKARIDNILNRISKAARAAGRDPSDITLVAVSKTFPAETVAAANDAGLDTFGENYVQEALKKIEALSGRSIHWHFIGHLQSNKAKAAVKHFQLIHSIDRMTLAKAVAKEAKKNRKVQPVLVQVNIGREKTKSGVDPDKTASFIHEICGLDGIEIRGLMAIPPYTRNPEDARPYFKALARLFEKIRKEFSELSGFSELSMGMSGDFEVAIEEGATIVRIGTAIFGERR